MNSDLTQYLYEQVYDNLPSTSLKHKDGTDKIVFRCVFCGDSHKSKTKKRGTYYKSTASFYCFNCGTTGSAYKLLEKLTGKSKDEIYVDFVREYKLSNNYENHISCFVDDTKNKTTLDNQIKSQLLNIISNSTKANVDIPSPIKGYSIHSLSNTAIEYLNKRAITNLPDNVFYSLISDTDESREFIYIKWNLLNKEQHYQIHNFKNLTFKNKDGEEIIIPKYKMMIGANKCVFGLDNIDNKFPYIYCLEGVYDSLLVKNGVALGGRFISEYQYKLIKMRYPNHKICLAFDNDIAGIQSLNSYVTSDMCNGVKTNTLNFLYWNENKVFGDLKDINEIVLNKHTSCFLDESWLRSYTFDRFTAMYKARNDLKRV